METNQKNRNTIIVTAITIAVLVVGVLGASYAYFAATLGTGSTTSVTVESKTLDNLTFTAGSAIQLTLTQTNMAKGSDDSYVDSNTANPSVKLIPRNDVNSTDKKSEYCYDIAITATTNTITSQPANTLKATVSLTGGSTCANGIDITNLAAGQSRTLCAGQKITATSYSASGVTKGYDAKVSFLNSASTNQSSLAGTTPFTGNITFTRVTCSS